MNRRAIQLILVAALVATAGCAGGMGGNTGNDSTTDDSSMMDSDGGAGTAAFYISDEPNVIDDFEHLNVTITKVGFKKAGGGGDGDSDESDDESTDEEADGESTNETDGETDDNETDEEEGEETDDNESDEDEGEETDGDDDGDASDGGWVEHDVDNRTVDLTELKGANASMIGEFNLSAGDYEKVFIHVSDTEGVLTDGNTTKVKLPSNKLQLNKKFTIGNGESVDFVYDIAPHKAGKSGKYILKPVISQSGTGDDVEIRDIDKEEKEEENDEEGDGEEAEADGNGNGGAEADSQDD